MENQQSEIGPGPSNHTSKLPAFLRMLLTGTVFVAIVLILYANTLDSPFVFDDVPFIAKNAHIAITDFSWTSLKNVAFSSTRPLTNLSFALNHYFTRDNVAGYHMVNMFLHALAGLGLYFLILSLFAIPAFSKKYGSPGWIPFLGAMLWLVHPIHTSAVTYIVQRSSVMASMFCLWSMAAYIQARVSTLNRQKWLGALSLCFWLLAMASKEIALALPFAILVFEWLFFHDFRKDWAGPFALILAGFSLLAILGAFIFLGSHPLDSILYDYKDFDFTIQQRLLTEPRVIVHYLSLLAFPYPGRLILDYDFTPSTALLNPTTTLASLALILGLFAASLGLAKKHRLVSYAVLWFLITLFLESSFIALDLAFEHRLYLPSVFPLVAVAVTALSLKKFRKLAVAALLCAIVLFGAWTIQRNQVWQTDLGLWQDTVSKAPNNARAQNNLGLALANAGHEDQAFTHFQKAAQLKPGFGHANYNLGICFANQGKHKSAIPYFQKAIEAEPENALYLNDLALAYMATGDLETALDRLYTALRLEPDYAPTHNNLGVALGGQAMVREALEHFRKAVELYPEYADAHRNLGILLASLDNHPKAIYHFNEVLKILPRDAHSHFFIGRSYAALGKLDKAAEHFQEAAKITPKYVPVLYNAGLTLMGLEKYPEAAEFFKQILRLEPQNQEASMRLKKCVDKVREKQKNEDPEPKA
ncbi:MAG: tetratricopeptide repeat protein [Desulfatibacillum sp.]|nr:tetratricopeptide repeat protein [Desulfatibacillum sp.]